MNIQAALHVLPLRFVVLLGCLPNQRAEELRWATNLQGEVRAVAAERDVWADHEIYRRREVQKARAYALGLRGSGEKTLRFKR